jgi:hypothetical protein
MSLIWKLFPAWVDAFAWNGKIHVRPGRVLSPGLAAHERVHLAQQQRDGKWRFLWRYFNPFSRKHRIHYEAEAYAESVRHGMPVVEAARLVAKYGGGITQDEALELLAAL